MSYESLGDVPNSLLATTAVVTRCSSLMSFSFLNPMRGENTSIRASFENVTSNVRIGARLKKMGGKELDRVPVVGRFLYLGWDERNVGETRGVLVVYAEMFPEIDRISRRKPMTKDEMLEVMWFNGFDTVDVGTENETPPVAYVPVGIILRHGKHNAADASRSDWCEDIAIALNESSFENPKPWNNILYKRDAIAIGRSLEIYDTYADYFKVCVKDMYEDTAVAVTTTDSSFANCFSPGIKIAGGALKNSEDVVVVRDINRIGRLCGYLFDKFDREAEKQLKVIVYLIHPDPYDKMFDAVMFDPYCSAYFARLVCMYDMRRGYVTCTESQCSYLDRISIQRR